MKPKRIIAGLACASAIALAPALRAETAAALRGPLSIETTVKDQVVGQITVADPERIKSETLVVRHTLSSTDLVLEAERDRQMCTAVSDVVERTTYRAAEGKGGFVSGAGAINVINPLSWVLMPALVGETPVTVTRQGSAQQSIKTVMRFHAQPKPGSCDTTISSRSPAAGQTATLRATTPSGSAPVVRSVTFDEFGMARIDLTPLIAPLRRGGAAPGGATLEVLPGEGATAPVLRIALDRATIDRVLTH